ncbi:unnamed protein product [Laminaria digitata]
MAFIQHSGQLSQTFAATETRQARLIWLEADRPNPNRGGQTYVVSINGTSVGTYTSSGTGFRPRLSATFAIISGTSYTIHSPGSRLPVIEAV